MDIRGGSAAVDVAGVDVWRLQLRPHKASCIYDDPEKMRDDLETMLDGDELPTDDVIATLQRLRFGDKFEHGDIRVERYEMSREEYEALPEFAGW